MNGSPTFTPGQRAEIACVLEATARKPGNVHRLADFDDCTYLDFLLSATALGRAFDRTAGAGIGRTVHEAVVATRRLVATNTNLGIILLLAPLAAAGVPTREGLSGVLASTTIDDARLVYEAIRLAAPGGLGRADEQDVSEEPTISLRDAMALASPRDAVARQYASDYADVFDRGLPSLRRALEAGWPLETAIVATHLTLMAEVSDTLIARKRGESVARESARRAREVLGAGWPRTESGCAAFADLDVWLRADGRALNPGATADLVAATLFAALDDGTIPLPVPSGPEQWTCPGAAGAQRA